MGLVLMNIEHYGPELKVMISDGKGTEDANMKRVLEASIARGVTFFLPVRASEGLSTG